MTAFAKALDSADRLTLDEQEELALTLQRKIAERRRAGLIRAVKESRDEFAKGRIRKATPAAILDLIRS